MTGRTRALIIGAALLVLGLSRLPFLLSQPDWGVFYTEHLWMIADAAAVDRWEALTGLSGSLAQYDPWLYERHYHGGALAITQAVRYAGRLFSGGALVPLELVGLALSAVGLCAYLGTLLHVWPGEPARWAVPTFVAWIAPPTLLLWLTLMPMGHYMETWFFHAVFLPPLVAVLADRAGPWTFALIGLMSGLAVAYVVSNVIFPALIAALFLLLTRRSVWSRIACVASLLVSSLAVWISLVGPRIVEIVDRLGVGDLQPSSVGTLAGLIAVGPADLVSRTVVVDGDVWSERGFFALFEPAGGTLGTTASYALAAAAAVGVGYLLRHTWLLLSPRRQELSVAGRLLGAQGVLVLMTFTGYLLFHRDTVNTSFVSYLTPTYAPVLFGLSQGAAALIARPPGVLRTVARPLVGGLLLLCCVGWVQSSLWTSRTLDRPDLQPVDFRTIGRLASMNVGDGAPDARDAQEFCQKAHPGDAAFCDVLGWVNTLPQHATSGLEGEAATRSCAGVEADRLPGCAAGRGARLAGEYGCELGPGDGLGHLCGHLPASVRQACLSGIYRGGVESFHNDASCTVEAMTALCGGVPSGDARDWQARSCLEGVALLMTGTPPLPMSQGEVQGACRHWPRDWQGLCQRLGAVRRAGPAEQSCEDVYLERFSTSLPERNRLIYQQCAYPGLVTTSWDLYPSCAIGVAKAMEGLQCSWRGDPLRL